MKALVAGCAVLAIAVAGWLFLGSGQGADTGKPGAVAPAVVEPPRHLVVHEWGTFTSFSGSDGVAVGFYPNNSDLPPFVYYQEDETSKAARLAANGTVSMETPVMYFYTDRPQRQRPGGLSPGLDHRMVSLRGGAAGPQGQGAEGDGPEHALGLPAARR